MQADGLFVSAAGCDIDRLASYTAADFRTDAIPMPNIVFGIKHLPTTHRQASMARDVIGVVTEFLHQD